MPTPTAHLTFDVTSHPARLHVVEALRGKSGYLTLNRQVIDSYETEDYLLFSGFDDEGHSLDQETLEKLFHCPATVKTGVTVPDPVTSRLAGEIKRHAEATVSKSLEANNQHFRQAREKLEQWAEDMVIAAEKALRDTKERIKVLQREARQATTLADQHRLQEDIQKLEKQKRRQRQDIFKVEDEIMGKRDALIDTLEQRLAQRTKQRDPVYDSLSVT